LARKRIKASSLLAILIVAVVVGYVTFGMEYPTQVYVEYYLPGEPLVNKVHVADTWNTVHIVFKDGTSTDLSSAKSGVYLALLDLATQNKVPDEMDFATKELVISDMAIPYITDLWGTKHYATDIVLDVTTEAKILVDGAVVYVSPSSGNRHFFHKGGKSLQSLISGATGEEFEFGQVVAPISYAGFDPDPYIAKHQPGETVTFELVCTQSWTMTAWFGTIQPINKVMGSTKAQVQPLKWPYTVPSGEGEEGEEGPKPDFIMSVSPTSTDIGTKAGTFRTFNVAALSVYKFSSTISFSTPNLPSGISAKFSRQSDTPSAGNGWIASTVLTLTASSSVRLGGATVSVVGSGGGLTHSVQITLQVKEEASADETVLKIATSLSLKLDKSAYAPSAPVILECKLSDYNGLGLSAKTVKITSDFDWSETITTDSAGEFKVETYAPKVEGSYTIHAEFQPDDKYSGARQGVAFDVIKEGTPTPTDWWQKLLAFVKSFFAMFGWTLDDMQATFALIAIVILILLILWLMFRPRSPQIVYG